MWPCGSCVTSLLFVLQSFRKILSALKDLEVAGKIAATQEEVREEAREEAREEIAKLHNRVKTLEGYLKDQQAATQDVLGRS